jgi:SAM-dependent methyltransferase
MTRLDDPSVVAAEYASEERLRRRAAAFHGLAPGQRDVKDRVVEVVAEVEPRRVLEVGCGWGELAERLVRATRAAVVAVDISPRMVELARSRGVDARVGDVQALEFGDGEFDCAVAAWMLYHVPDLDRGVAELTRVLRPGGRLVAVTTSSTHLHELRDLVGSGPSPAKFTRENGVAILRRDFERVAREDDDGVVEFATRADVDEYVRASIAMSPFADRLPLVVAEPFRATRAVSLFLADKAA